jgi:transposase-like protein
MNTQHLRGIPLHLEDLTYPELKKLKHEVDGLISKNQVGEVIAKREDRLTDCPSCSSSQFTRWGFTKQGVQRFKCKACLQTFNALKGTPLYRMRMSQKWVQYNELMWHGATLRDCAKDLDISLRTAFRWRHTFLKAPSYTGIQPLSGVIEADETFINESFKGKRILHRDARKRGGGKSPKTPILIALNREGSVIREVVDRNTKESICQFLQPRIADGPVLCTDGNKSYIEVANGCKIDHKRIIGLDKIRVVENIYHIQTLNNYIMNWKEWMVRFRGVGREYLTHYLSWFRHMKQHKKSDQGLLFAAMTNT